jgi:hypothetical protein
VHAEAEVHETALKAAPEPALGAGSIVQVVPFQRSASVTLLSVVNAP